VLRDSRGTPSFIREVVILLEYTFWRSFTLHGYLPHAGKVREKKKKRRGEERKKKTKKKQRYHPIHPTVLVSYCKLTAIFGLSEPFLELCED